MWTPEEVTEPTIRTIGKGCMRLSGGEVTWIVSLAPLARPSAAVTRSHTTWAPGVEKEVLSTGPPTRNAPPAASAQANAVIGLASSVESDTSETRSPVIGSDGNHLKDATGGSGPVAAGAVTVKMTGALVPVLPASSDCSARAVYVPGLRPPKVADQAPSTASTARVSK